jgi:ribonuclease HII
MAVLVGIDEAGFGPILGPLVVSSSVFRVPNNLVWADFWQILRKSVSAKRSGLTGRLLIADSKKAYSKTIGIRHIRRTALAVLKHLEAEPANLTGLITTLCPDCLEHLREYPWYKNIDEYRLNAESADLGIAVSMLRKDLDNQHIELLDLKSRVLEVAYYNKMINAVKNKAKVLFSAVSQLIQQALDEYKNEDLEIVVDHQGGRCHYGRQLQLMFGQMDLRIINEDQQRSRYELRDGERKVRVHFVVGADDKYLPVALASMASKYVREVLVDNINRYFIGLNSRLKPTAGYWKDGLRFIKDIKTHIPTAKFDSNQLVRLR